jgi:hypothetical protein
MTKRKGGSILKVIRSHKASELWRGLDAALLRQLVYGSIRFGLYGSIQQVVANKVLAAFLVGGLSSAMCNPLDLVKVRMQAAYGGKGSSYPSVFAAFQIIVHDEGVASLWTGAWPTVYRASVIAAVELSSYDKLKSHAEAFLQLPSTDVRVFIAAALCASVLTALISCPFDVARSRMMNQNVSKMGKGKFKTPNYRGALECMLLIVREEGFLALWTGCLSYLLRLGPNAILTFTFLELIRSFLMNNRY